MNSKLISVLKFLSLLAIAVALLFFAFRGVSIGKIFSEILRANLFWLLLSLIPSIIAFFSRAYRWNLLMEPLGYSPPLKKTTYSLMVGYFANLAFPRLGEVTRCAALSKAEAIPFNILLGTVIVERAVDLITLFLLLIMAGIIEFKRLGSVLNENIIHPAFDKLKHAATSPVFILAALVLIAGFLFLFYYLRKKSRQSGQESKTIHLFKGLASGLKAIGKLKRPWLFIFHSLFIWFLYYISVYLCLFALPSTAGLGLTAALFLLVAGGLGMSAPVQGGIVAYHLLVSQGLMLYGLSRQDGLAFATLAHTSQIALVVLFGSASLLLLFLENKKNRKSLVYQEPGIEKQIM